MKKILATLAIAAIAAIPAAAHDYKAGALHIVHPWARATPAGAKVGGGYLKIENSGKEADRLVDASAAVAGRVEVHEMAVVDNVMKMRELPKGLEIKPGETVELKPGSFHLMMMELKEPLKAGTMVKGSLQFEKAGKVDVEFKVEGIGAAAPAASTHDAMNGGHDMGSMKDMHH